MTSCEKSARTQEEAIEAALEELNASISDVEVQVLDEGSKGLFGLFGSRLARVRVTLKNASEEDDPLEILSESNEPVPEAAPVTEEPKSQKPAVKEEPKPVTEARPAARPEPVRRVNKAPEKPVEKQPEPEVENTPATPAAEKPVVSALEKPEVTPVSDEELNGDTAAARAYAFLSELTRLMGVSVEIILCKDAEGNLYAQMTGDTLGILIGRRGETLDALQYLTSLKINRGQDNYTRITLDTENYRAKREDTLVRLANRMANRAVKSGRKVVLEPMNPYERRIIHSALQANKNVETHSEGEEPNRRVVITLVH